MQFFQASWVNRWNLCGSPLSTKNVSSCCAEVSQSESPDHKVHQEQPSAPQHQISECLTQQVVCRFPLCSRLVLSLFYLCSRIFHQHLHKPAHLSSSCQFVVELSSRCSAGLAEAGNLPASAHLEAIQTRFNQFNGQKHSQNQTI